MTARAAQDHLAIMARSGLMTHVAELDPPVTAAAMVRFRADATAQASNIMVVSSGVFALCLPPNTRHIDTSVAHRLAPIEDGGALQPVPEPRSNPDSMPKRKAADHPQTAQPMRQGPQPRSGPLLGRDPEASSGVPSPTERRPDKAPSPERVYATRHPSASLAEPLPEPKSPQPPAHATESQPLASTGAPATAESSSEDASAVSARTEPRPMAPPSGREQPVESAAPPPLPRPTGLPGAAVPGPTGEKRLVLSDVTEREPSVEDLIVEHIDALKKPLHALEARILGRFDTDIAALEGRLAEKLSTHVAEAARETSNLQAAMAQELAAFRTQIAQAESNAAQERAADADTREIRLVERLEKLEAQSAQRVSGLESAMSELSLHLAEQDMRVSEGLATVRLGLRAMNDRLSDLSARLTDQSTMAPAPVAEPVSSAPEPSGITPRLHLHGPQNPPVPTEDRQILRATLPLPLSDAEDPPAAMPAPQRVSPAADPADALLARVAQSNLAPETLRDLAEAIIDRLHESDQNAVPGQPSGMRAALAASPVADRPDLPKTG